jgi:hypothetical protein
MAFSAYAGKVGWTVGRASWLDDPASMVNRYWRQVEQGENFAGVILIGLWGDRAGTNERPNRLRDGSPLTAAGEGSHEKFVPFGETDSPATALHRARFAFWYYITGGKMGRPSDTDLSKLRAATPSERRRIFFWIMSKATLNQIPFVSARAKRSVEGRHYYTRALDSFNVMEVEIDMLREAIAPLIVGMFTQGKARAAVAGDSYSSGWAAATVRKGPTRSGARGVESYLGSRGYAPSLGYDSHMGIAVVTASSNVQDLIRTGGGQFPSGQWQAAIIDVNRKVALQFQEHVVSLMRDSVLRPPTGDLVRATRDPRNRYPE